MLFGDALAVDATDAGLDHPAVEEIGFAVNFAVTRREWDAIGGAVGRAMAAFNFAAEDADEGVAEAACAVFSRNFLLTLTALNFFG